MAQVSKGSFVTNASEGRSLTFNWSVDSTSISGNYKKIYWSLIGSGSASGYVMAGDFKVVIDGKTVYNSSNRINVYNGTVVASGYVTLYHNAQGNKSFSASVQASIYEFTVDNTGSGTWELPTIPRYAKFTEHLISGYDETSVTVKWNTDVVCDLVQYSLNGGSWQSASFPSYTVSGLTHNTSYKIKTRIRRKESQLWTESGELTFKTYSFPYCTSSPNFSIGDALTLDFYNPLGRSITVAGYSKKDGSEIFTGTTSGTRLTGFNDNQSVNKQYASIPNSQDAEYTVVVVYNDIPMTRDAGNIYKIRGNEIPTINGFDYIDNNSSTVAITGDNTKIVQNLSILLVRFHSATANKGAGGISQYYIECNGIKKNGSKEGSYNLGTIDSSRDVDLKLTAVDSRGLSASKTIKVSMLAHSTPSANVTLERLNNYEDETYLTVDGSISSVGGKNTMTIKYRYKVSGGTYTSYVNIGDKTKKTLSLDKNNAYSFNVVVTDAFGSTFTGEYLLNKGVFPLFIDTGLNSVGINCFPKEENSLEVNELNVYKVAKNINVSIKQILLGSSDGLTIQVNDFGGTDKIALIVAGADNSSMIPVFTVIHMRSGSGFGHINLGLDSTVTRDGNRMHITAGQWSHFTVIAPIGCDISLSNSSL